MITKGIKNFFVNLKHFFTPLGAFAIGVIIGLSIFFPAAANSISALSESVKNIVDSTSLDFATLRDKVWEAVRALDWSDPAAAVFTMLGKDWLTATLTECVDAFVSDGGTSAALIEQAVATAVADIAAGFVALIIFSVLGLIGGFFLTKYLVRRNMAKRGIWKWLVASVVDSVLTALFLLLTVWIEAIWTPGGVIAGILSLLLLGLITLFEAYLVHGRGKVQIKNAVSFKNILKLFLTDVIILAITAAIAAVILAVANAVVSVFLCLPLIEIAIIVMSLNAEAYVKSLADANAGIKK